MKIISFHPFFTEIAIHFESQFSFIPDDVVGILAYNQATKEDFDLIRAKYRKVIMFQFEQLWIGSYWINERFHYIAQNSDLIVDYDLDNIEIFNQMGYKNVLYNPLMYSPVLDNSDYYRNHPCDIDVLYCGTITDDRARRMNEFFFPMVEAGYHAICYFGPLDDTYYGLVARSRMILNTHHFQVKRQQQARIFPLLSSGKMILSEQSARNIYGNSVIEAVDGADLIEKFGRYIYNRRWHQFGLDARENLINITNYDSINEKIENALK